MEEVYGLPEMGEFIVARRGNNPILRLRSIFTGKSQVRPVPGKSDTGNPGNSDGKEI
jgi:hypothetical protein